MQNPIVFDFLKSQNPIGATPVHSHAADCGCEEKLTLLPLRYYPDSVLKQKCEPIPEVTSEITKLAKDMIYTMMVERGVGLAGPQVGKLLRIFVVDISWIRDVKNADPHILINPEIEPFNEQAASLGAEVEHDKVTPKITSNEGCLSFPGGYGKVERYESIRVTYLDMDGNHSTMTATGFLARAIQHENDHLNGITIQQSIPAFDLREVSNNIKMKLRERIREQKPAHKKPKPKNHRRS
jgi:peptide deformylase